MANEKLMKGHILDFASQMKKLVNCKDHSDIKFLIGPNRKPIYAHRCLLSSRCAVFKAMFSDQAQKGDGAQNANVPFVLTDIQPDIFLAMLEFIYTNCVTLTPKIAIDTMASALEYGLDELRKLCGDYLIDNLSVQNACECMQAAVAYSQQDLRDHALRYIEEHTDSVFKSKSFQELSEDAIIEILSSDELQLDELDIIKYVKEWATVNAVVLSKPMSEVARKIVAHIRLAILTSDEVEKAEKDSKKDNLIPVECFASAWKFHATKRGDKSNPLLRCRKGTTPRPHHQSMESQ
ncbi:hypothetical protein FSP39_006158 [Pinctada imbricata]|uniref:BTB domain-containing protein n=1 Tax=Pinctada imbricata TaxID=66713 RepID=A0AA88XWL6_PINIB|nr:hypothetical protein FSP39_006158 [Pinctada imbricata]